MLDTRIEYLGFVIDIYNAGAFFEYFISSSTFSNEICGAGSDLQEALFLSKLDAETLAL